MAVPGVPAKRTSDYCKTVEFPMKAYWKVDAQAVASSHKKKQPLNPLVKGSSFVTPSTQATENKEVTSLKEDGGNPENPELVSGLFFESENDQDLKLFIQRWPKLPEHIKAAVRSLIQTHITEKK